MVHRAPLALRALTALAVSLTVACSDAGTAAPRGPLAARVACASAPAEALAALALAGAVPLVRPVPADADPSHWVPTRDAVAALRDARLVVFAGAGLEAWSTAASLPPSRLVEAAAGSEASWIELPVTRHTHGDGEEHSHGGSDPHVWLDPALLAHQLARIQAAAERAFPDSRDALAAAQATTDPALAGYRADLAALAPALAGAPLLAAWPCYGYLARALGTTVVAVPLDPWAADGRPTDGALRKLEQSAAGSARVLLWPAPPPAELAARLERELGLVSVHFDALLRPATGAEGSERSGDAGGAASVGADDALARLRASVARLAAAVAAARR